MKLVEHWQQEAITARLAHISDMDGVLYEVRHALRQTEQNALAEMDDDVLRQQAGVLFQAIRGGLSFLEVPIAKTVWVARHQQEAKAKLHWTALAALCVQLALAAWFYLQSQWIVMGVFLAGLAFGVSAYILRGKKKLPQENSEVSVRLSPDPQKLNELIVKQLQSADRYLTDFSFLNNQLRSGNSTDNQTLSRAVDLAEALCDLDEETRMPLENAAKSLLESLGLTLLDYSPEKSGFFNLLPSRQHNRTLAPAILNEKDGRLIRRGTAVVVQK